MIDDSGWRHTARNPRLFMLDASAVYPLLVYVFVPVGRTYILFTALTLVVVLTVLERRRMLPSTAVRAAWAWVRTLGYRARVRRMVHHYGESAL